MKITKLPYSLRNNIIKVVYDLAISPLNLIRYNGGKKIYYLDYIEKHNNGVIVHHIKCDNYKKYEHVIYKNKKFTDVFTFVDFNEIPNDERINIHETIRESKYYAATKYNPINLQPSYEIHTGINTNMENIRMDAMVETLKNQPSLNMVTIKEENIHLKVDDLYNEIEHRKATGMVESYDEDEVVIIKKEKKKSHEKIILEEDVVHGLPKDFKEKEAPTYEESGCIIFDRSLYTGIIGGSVTSGNGLIFSHNNEGIRWEQQITPHNGIKYNDKVVVDEEKLLIKK